MCSGDNHIFHQHPELVQGERAGRHKLANDDIDKIRTAYDTNTISQRQLSRLFGVGQSVISRIVTGTIWQGRGKSSCHRKPGQLPASPDKKGIFTKPSEMGNL
jgi:hypothetical protein